MRIGPDIIQSISENGIDISSSWAFLDSDVYSPRYTEIISNPISLEATTLDYFRFKVDTVNIQIRKGVAIDSELIWSGISYNIQDEANESEEPTNSTVQQVSTGVVGDMAPAAVYGQGTISIESAHVNLRDNPGHVGSIVTYLLTSASFTLTDGTEQYVVADYNNGSPIYRLENNKTNINSSNIVLIRVCWRNGVLVHSVDNDSAGSDLANKIEAAILQTTPYRKSLDGGLTLSETSTPIARTVLMTPAVVYAGTFPHSLSAFNSSTNKFTFASVANGVWSYTSGTTQYNNTQFNPITGLSTLGNNNYSVIWFYRSVGNDVEVFYVLGASEYPSLAKAQTASLRSDLSLLLRDHCILCGRIIVQKGASSGVVENVSDVSFTSSQITIHNDLQNLQGGSAATSEYYHLSAATYNKLTSGFNPAVRGLFSESAPISYNSSTGAFSHSTTGTAGTYTKVVTNATGHITSGSVLTSADIPNLSATYITTNQKGVANGVASLDSNAKVPLSQLPATTIVDTFVVASSAAQLALSAANQGDVCVRTDINKTYILKSDPYSIWGNWQEMLTPTNSVTSVFGRIGVITALSADYASFYAPIVHNQAWSTITSVPTASTSTSGVITSTDWNTFNNKASTTQLTNYLPLSGGTLTGNLFGTTASFGNASLASYTPNGNYAWFGKNGENPAVGTNLAGMITGDGETYIGARAGKMVRLDVSGVDVVTIGGSLVRVYQPTLFSSSVTLANNTWNAIGDDSQFGDMNVGNTVGFRGIQNTNTGYIRFGTTSAASTGTLLNDFGWDGSKFTIGTNTVWHSGNLTDLNQLTNGPGYVTSAVGGTIYAPLTHLHTGQYLPLSGGTLTGNLSGTTASFSGNAQVGTYVYSRGYDGTTYTTPGFVGDWNSAYTWGIVGGNGALNDNTIGFRTLNASKTAIGYANIAAGSAAFNGATMPAWGASLNPIMLGGESFLYSYKVSYGTQPTLGSNFYYDGTNLKVIGTYTNSNYPRALVFENNGTLSYNISTTSPVAGTTITDLTTKFSVSKEGNGTFAGTISEGGTLLSTKYSSSSHLHTGQYLPLSGGTLTGDLYIGNNYIRSGAGDATIWNDGANFRFGSAGVSRGMYFQDSSTNVLYWTAGGNPTFTRTLVGTTAAFSGSATFHNSIQKPWPTNAYPIALAGETGIYSYMGTNPAIYANYYYVASNAKYISTASNTRYARILQLNENGTLYYYTSVTSPTADANITDLSVKFSVSKEGNGSFSNSVFAPTISGTNTYGGKGLVKSAAIGFGAFFGTVDTGTLATTVGIIVDETSTQTYYSQKTGGNHSFYINGTQTASIDAGGINGVGNLSIANIGNGGIRLYGETVTGNGVVSLSPILKYGFSTVIANTGYVRFPVSIQGAIIVINGKSYGAPITSTKATVQSGVIYPKGSGTVTTIDCDERRMFIGNGTDWFEV